MADESNGKYKILIVDDDADILNTMRLALTELDQEVFTARDGLEAVEIAKREDPDIVVLDLMLPRRGGFQILNNLKGKPDMKGKRPLMCMVTGNQGMLHRKLAERLGVDNYLQKPFAMGRLLDAVREFIERLDAGIEDAKPKASS
jgi:DNA-binding response OmpR family regulator